MRAAVKLADLAVFLPEGMNHAHRSKPLLHGGQQGALPFLNDRALGADFFCEVVDGQNNQRNDGEGQEGQLGIEPDHDDEGGHEHDDRGKNVGEPPVVNRLDRLGVISNPEAGVTRTPGIMELQGEPLHLRIEFRAHADEGLEPGIDQEIARAEIGQASQHGDDDQDQAEEEDHVGRIRGRPEPLRQLGTRRRSAGRSRRENTVDDVFEGPRLEQVESGDDQTETEGKERFAEERTVISERAAVDAHDNPTTQASKRVCCPPRAGALSPSLV